MEQKGLQKKKIPLSSSCVAQLLQSMALPWAVVNIPNDTFQEKADFPFASGYQVQITSWLGMWPCVYLPLSVGPVWLEAGQVWYMLPQSLWAHLCIGPICVLFLEGIASLELDNCLFCFSFRITPDSCAPFQLPQGGQWPGFSATTDLLPFPLHSVVPFGMTLIPLLSAFYSHYFCF